jgi:uncharacterized membrane-anchored protein YjiN (DUF445 family)
MNVEQGSRRALRLNRAVASGLLLAMAFILFGTFAVSEPGFWILLVRASAEAALVGGLADWFAVTALFRRPLGLPIPHTAIVPNNKDRIGEGLAVFLQQNFFTREIMAATLHSADPARRLADWLAVQANADFMADQLLRLVPHFLHLADDHEIRAFFAKALREQLQEVDFTPLIGLTMGELAATGYHGTLVDDALKGCQAFLDHRRDRFEELVAERHQGWLRKTVDRQIARAILRGVEDFINDLLQPGSRARQKLLQAIEERAQAALVSPVDRVKFDEAKTRILEHPDVQAWLALIWDKLRDATIEDIASNTSKAKGALSSSISSLGVSLAGDINMRAKLNASLEAAIAEFLPWRTELLNLITQVIRNWDARMFSERIELAVGSDLQYIRINGTVVGACIGCVLRLAQVAIQ